MPERVPAALLVLVLLVAMAPTLSLIGSELNNDPGYSQVSVAVSVSPLTAPFFIAEHQGYFQACGLDVLLVPRAGGLRAFETMAAGDTDFATSSDSVVTFAATQRNNFTVLASFASSDNDVKILATAGKSFSNGQIKSVGYYPGTASEYLLKTYLAVHNIDANAFQLVPLDAVGLTKQFSLQQLDAIVIWEPYLWQAKQLLQGPSEFIDSRNLHSLHFDLIANSSFMLNQEADALKLLSALQKAILFIHENPQQSKAILAQALNETEGLVDSIWPNYQYKINFAEAHTFSYLANERWLDLTDRSASIDPRKFIFQPKQVPPIAISYRQLCGAT